MTTIPLSRSFALFVAAVALAIAGCSPQAKKDRHLAAGDRAFAAGQYDQAEIEYLNVLNLDALNPTAMGRVGLIYFEQGRLGRSFPLLVKARDLDPDNLAIHQKAGLLFLATGNLGEARKEALYILDRNPSDAEAPLILAESAIKPDEIQAVRQRIEKLPPPAVDSAAALIALGTLELRQGKLDAAETFFKRAEAKDPSSGSTYAALGTLYRLQRKLPEAEVALQRAAELSPPRSPRQLLYPKFKVQTGDVAAGRRRLEEIVKQTPDYLPPWIMLAEIAAAERKYDESLSLVGKVLARDQVNPEALLLSSRLRLAKGEADKAVDELERMLKVYPQSPQVHYQLGTAYAAKRDSEKAASNLSRAIALAPGYTEAILLLAEINMRRGEITAAIAALKPVVQQHPEIAQARMLLADAYRSQGNLESALDEYRRLEELFPNSPQTYLLKGMVLMRQNKRDDARAAFSKAVELAPDFLLATEQLVDLDLLDKDYAAALRRLDPLIASNPNQPGPYLLRAKVFVAQQDRSQAEVALGRAIELQPDSPAAYLLLARLYVSSREMDKALANFRATAAKDPKNVEAWMLIGLILDQKKDYAGSRDAYETLLKINPDFGSALNNLACLYADHLDRLDRASELAQRARELMPIDPHIADSLGWILFKQRQYPRALGLLRESAAKLPDSPAVQYHLAMVFYVMGNDEAALRLFKKALELDPALPDAPEAKRCLEILAIDGATAGAAERARLEKYAVERPDDPALLVRLAAIYERNGEFDRALQACEAAQKSNPNNASVLLQLVRLQVARKDNAKALEVARNARKLAPDDPAIACALGRLAYQAGDFRWAAGLLQEAKQKMPDDADVLYDFAEAAFAVGQIAEAADAAQRALQSSGVFLRADSARLLIELAEVANNPVKADASAPRIDTALKNDPNHLPALYGSGLLSEQNAKLEDAKKTYEKLLARYPDFTPARRRLTALTTKKVEQPVPKK